MTQQFGGCAVPSSRFRRSLVIDSSPSTGFITGAIKAGNAMDDAVCAASPPVIVREVSPIQRLGRRLVVPKQVRTVAEVMSHERWCDRYALHESSHPNVFTTFQGRRASDPSIKHQSNDDAVAEALMNLLRSSSCKSHGAVEVCGKDMVGSSGRGGPKSKTARRHRYAVEESRKTEERLEKLRVINIVARRRHQARLTVQERNNKTFGVAKVSHARQIWREACEDVLSAVKSCGRHSWVDTDKESAKESRRASEPNVSHQSTVDGVGDGCGKESMGSNGHGDPESNAATRHRYALEELWKTELCLEKLRVINAVARRRHQLRFTVQERNDQPCGIRKVSEARRLWREACEDTLFAVKICAGHSWVDMVRASAKESCHASDLNIKHHSNSDGPFWTRFWTSARLGSTGQVEEFQKIEVCVAKLRLINAVARRRHQVRPSVQERNNRPSGTPKESQVRQIWRDACEDLLFAVKSCGRHSLLDMVKESAKERRRVSDPGITQHSITDGGAEVTATKPTDKMFALHMFEEALSRLINAMARRRHQARRSVQERNTQPLGFPKVSLQGRQIWREAYEDILFAVQTCGRHSWVDMVRDSAKESRRASDPSINHQSIADGVADMTAIKRAQLKTAMLQQPSNVVALHVFENALSTFQDALGVAPDTGILAEEEPCTCLKTHW